MNYFDKLKSRFRQNLNANQDRWSYSKRPFIFPTRSGIIFGAFCFLFLIVAYFYENNLVYLYVFFIISFGHSVIWLSHSELMNISFQKVRFPHFFANEASPVQIEILNQSNAAKQKFTFTYAGVKKTIENIQGQTSTQVEILYLPKARGKQQSERIVLESFFPYGLFRTWRVYAKRESVYVFPEKKGAPLNLNNLGSDDILKSKSFSPSGISDFQGHQRWTPYLSVKSIDWKASSKSSELLSKKFSGENSTEVTIDVDLLINKLGLEPALSQVSLWLDQLSLKPKISFSIFSKEIESTKGEGASHRDRLLIQLTEEYPV